MDLYNGFQTKNYNKFKSLYDLSDLGLHEDTHLVIIKLSKSWLLKFISRAIILALIILSFPWLNKAIDDLASSVNGSSTSLNTEMLPLMFHDLANEGLIKSSDKALFIAVNGNQESSINELQYNNMEVIHETKLLDHQQHEKTLINHDDQMLFDFVFACNYHATTSDFINKSLKVGGIVVIPLNENPSSSFQKPSNYKIVYLRRFDSTIIAMKRLADSDDHHRTQQQQQKSSASQRKLLSTTNANAKKAALKNLEDVLLEPPRSSSGKSRKYLKQTRYLPDLMGDSLENYPRRVFIDVGLHDKNDNDDDSNWFVKHYPTRNKDFEIYKIDTVAAEPSSDLKVVTQIGMSDWLAKNVKENEYVVMKAEADVVEEMVKSKTIQLVDELFMECKHQGIKKGGNKSKRAYWECLALYGILRDEGVAVHQWWG